MLKKASILIVLISSCVLSFAQNFEGKITYQSTFKSKIPNVTDELFTSMMGSAQDYVIKGGNYKNITNGTLVQWQIYVNKDNKLYSKLANSPNILYNDGSENKNEVIKAEVNKNAVTILGYKCDELILTCKDGVQKFYYNEKIKVDPALFQNHKYGNWYEVLTRTKSLPLKMIIEHPQFSSEMTASNITAEKVDDKTFELPANVAIEKSPY
jgi:hypothetical protein